MQISNRLYDILKWVALVALPAIQAFWLTIGKVWGFPYLTEIGTTIAAIGLLIAALIGVSSNNYYNDVDEEDEDDDEDYDEDQSELLEKALAEYEEEGDE